MKNRLFKIVSLILTLIMLLTCAVPMGAFAAQGEEYVPSVVIPGIFQSDVNLYVDGEKSEEYAPPFFLDKTENIVMDALLNAIVPISKMLITQDAKDEAAAQAVADVLGRTLLSKNFDVDENGNRVNDIRATKYGSVADCSDYDKNYIYDQIPLRDYATVAGEENLYFFSYYSFDSIKSLAEELYQYIQRVKTETGSNKVNIVPISQGGTLANALLELHPEVINDLNRIVYIVPALDGSYILGDIYVNGLIDDDIALYHEMFPKLLGEDSELVSYLIGMILRIMPNANVNRILDIAVDVLIEDYLERSTCMWALIPSSQYPVAAEKYLADEEDAAIRAEADWYYGAQVNSDKNIMAAVDAGVKVFNIVDYNYALYPIVDCWDDVNADGVIHVDSTSMGATTVAVDVPLPADYVPVNSNCTDPTHNHIDSRRLVDASTGLLPETTFYFCGQNHESTARNDVIISLAIDLLLDESFTSVHTYPDKYPQFNGSRNARSYRSELNTMKNYNYANVNAADYAEMMAAIAELEAALDNTVITDESNAELDAAVVRFRAARDKIFNPNASPEAPEEEPDFLEMLKGFFTIVFKYISKLFYDLFGGKGFSEM